MSRRTRTRALVLSLLVSIACTCALSLAHAAPPTLLESGVSGSCTWKYERVDGNTVLTIAPTEGREGTLVSFSWNSSSHKRTTKRVAVKETVKVGPSAREMFREFEQATSIDVAGLDVAGVTDMEKMFYRCYYLTSLDVSNWNVSNVRNMDSMFFWCADLTSLDVSKWNVSNVTSMWQTFNGCFNLTSLDVSNWNVSNVTSMWQTFDRCFNLTSLDVSRWNVSNVTDMDSMFFRCWSLTSLDVSKWDVSSVRNMASMFSECEALASLDVSKWNVSNVTDMSYTFAGCTSLTSLDLSGWETSKVETMKEMFDRTSSLKDITLGNKFHIKANAGFEDAGSRVGTHWVQLKAGDNVKDPTGKVFDTPDDLREFHNKKTGPGSERYVRHAVTKGESGGCMWEYIPLDVKDVGGETYKLRIRPLEGNDSGTLENWQKTQPPWQYSACVKYRNQTTKLEVLKGRIVAKPVKAPTCWNMFTSFGKLTDVNIPGLDTSQSTGMSSMFHGCKSLTSLDVSGLKTKDVVSMYAMFSGCVNLVTLTGMEGWETDKVTNMQWMFNNCRALTSLNLSGWDTSKVGDSPSKPESMMKNMFRRTHSLKDITLGNNFHIKGDAKFEDAGSSVGGYWAQVAGGTAENPKGQVFASAIGLANFHHDRTKRQTDDERYVRVTPTLVITFDKGAADATGTVEPQSFAYNEEKPLTENAYQREGHEFNGWKDAEGNSYTDRQRFKSTVLGFNVQKTLTAQWKRKTYRVAFEANVPDDVSIAHVPPPQSVKHGDIFQVPDVTLAWEGHVFKGWNTESNGTGTPYNAGSTIENVTANITLYAQWEDEVTLTYIKKDPAESGFTLSCSSETLGVRGEPSGCKVVGEVPFGKEVKWAVAEGGNDSASTWSRTKTELGKEDIEAAAKKGDKLVATTFAAKLVPKTYTITFNANVPDGVSIANVPQSQSVKHGDIFQVPDVTLAWEGHVFKGWNTEQDGKGTFYKATEKIESVVANITLHAQWEDEVTLTYIKKDPAESGFTLSCSSETLGVSDEPSGCKVTGVDESKTIKWTVTKGGNDSASTWSCTKTELKAEDIEAAAKKDNKLVATTFAAKLVPKTYTITFDANVPDGVSIANAPQSQSVEHGNSFQVPDVTLVWEGHVFKGWNTESNGTGTPYNAGSTIENVTANITLYAQWEDEVTLTYIKKDPAESGFTLSCSSETLGVRGEPSGCKVVGEVPFGKEVKWTVTKGGNDSASTWSRTKTELKAEDIKAAAKKDNKLVATTFAAKLVPKTYTITFNANVPDGVSIANVPQSQSVEHGNSFQVPDVTLVWEGHVFKGWTTESNGTGTPYNAGSTIENVTANITLYAQWEDEVTLTYIKKDPAESGFTLSRSSETLGVSDEPAGCEVVGEVPFGKEVKWTVAEGGNDNASTWSRTKTELGKEDIEAAAKKGDKLVATTFAAKLVPKTYTITFNANVPDGVSIANVPQSQSVKHGDIFQVPDVTLVWEGHVFKGWTTEQDGKGTFYKATEKIESVVANITLHAQWEDAVTLTYIKKDPAESGFTLSRSSETLGVSDEPSGCKVTGVDESKTIKWTVTKGGNDSASTWSCTKAKLEAEDIKAAAKKDKKLVATTFAAKLVPKTYTITFDANVPDGVSIANVPQSQSVEHGNSFQVPDVTLVWEGHVFKGWTTEQDGKGTFYKATEKIESVVANITLHAQWEDAVIGPPPINPPAVPEPTPTPATGEPNPTKPAQGPNPTKPAQGPKQGNTEKRFTLTNPAPELRSARRQEPSYPSGWYQDDNRVFYYRNRRKLTGWHELEGTIQEPWSLKKNWFYFDKKGIMLTGRHRLIGGFKNAQGVQEEHWFGLDEKTGAQIRGWQRVGNGSSEKWYYYRPEDGTGLVGRHRIVGGFKNARGVRELNWFYFNKVTGAQIRGWHKITEDGTENWYYYRDCDGIMLKGRHRLVGGFKNAQGVQEMNWFYFDRVTGIEVRGWHKIIEGGFERWYYYRDGDGIMLKGRHRLVGGFKNAQGAHEMNWFYFNDATGIEIRGWHKIIEGGVERWYYYRDGDGIMLKGQHRLTGGFKNQQGVHEMNWFYFDDITGVELRNCWKDISSQNKTCYYGSDGAMYKGWRVIDGRWYYFDDATGARH